jgi:hypothetical protein
MADCASRACARRGRGQGPGGTASAFAATLRSAAGTSAETRLAPVKRSDQYAKPMLSVRIALPLRGAWTKRLSPM